MTKDLSKILDSFSKIRTKVQDNHQDVLCPSKDYFNSEVTVEKVTINAIKGETFPRSDHEVNKKIIVDKASFGVYGKTENPNLILSVVYEEYSPFPKFFRKPTHQSVEFRVDSIDFEGNNLVGKYKGEKVVEISQRV